MTLDPHARPGFEAVPRRDGEDVVIFFHGELDLAGAPRAARVMSVVGDVVGARIVLDLSGLSFIDARGIGAIEGARDRMRRQGRQVIVRNPPPAIRRVLELCGLDDWFRPPAIREGFFALSSRPAPRPVRGRIALELGGAPPPG